MAFFAGRAWLLPRRPRDVAITTAGPCTTSIWLAASAGRASSSSGRDNPPSLRILQKWMATSSDRHRRQNGDVQHVEAKEGLLSYAWSRRAEELHLFADQRRIAAIDVPTVIAQNASWSHGSR